MIKEDYVIKYLKKYVRINLGNNSDFSDILSEHTFDNVRN